VGYASWLQPSLPCHHRELHSTARPIAVRDITLLDADCKRSLRRMTAQDEPSMSCRSVCSEGPALVWCTSLQLLLQFLALQDVPCFIILSPGVQLFS
jgi:hypothetical protein